MVATAEEVQALAAETKRLRQAMDLARARYYAQAGSYDAMTEAAKAFCAAFYAYQVAKVGKSKARRANWRAVIR